MPAFQLLVDGMTCEACVRRVREALAAVPGVVGVDVKLSGGRARVEVPEEAVAGAENLSRQLAEAIRGAGYHVVNATFMRHWQPIPEEAPEPVAAAPSVAAPNAATPSGAPAFVPMSQLSAAPARPSTPTETVSRPPENAAAQTHDTAKTLAGRLSLHIEGMHCASCTSRVETALRQVSGVSAAAVSLATDEARVTFDPATVTVDRLLRAVEQAGYAAHVATDAGDLESATPADNSAWQRRLLVGGMLLAPLLLLDAAGARERFGPWLEALLATPVQFYLGGPFFAGALRRLRARSTNMDTLVALGAGAAYGAGVVQLIRSGAGGHGAHGHAMYFMDAAMILVFVTLGKFLEARAKGQAAAAIRDLMDLAPREAVLLRDGQPVAVPVDEVQVGDLLVIRPGARIPLDAKIRTGMSGIDESWLTGESLPVEKNPGDDIYAGAINTNGALTAKVTRLRPETMLAQVARLVRDAQQSKTQVERLADRVVARFVPGVLLIALATFLGWWLIQHDLPTAVRSTVAVLVVACPCALGLATPTAIMVASGRAARSGILVKDAAALETAGRLTHLIFDKTGTVTEGRPQVTMVLPAEGRTAEELLAYAAAAESLSQHPLSQSVVRRARRDHVEFQSAEALEVLPGQGIAARVGPREVLVGNERLFTARGHDAARFMPHADALREDGETPLGVAVDGQPWGMLALSDVVAPHTNAALDSLRQLGLTLEILSGDHPRTVEAIGRQLQITQVTAGVLPAEKVERVRQARQPGQIVAMIGDGINDAPAMAAADVGIALATGADLAIDAAQLVLMSRDLRSVPRAIRLARATLRTIRQNLAWAFVYNAALLPLAACWLTPFFGPHAYLPPTAAAAAMALSSVSVVANSLLLRWRRID